MKNFDYFLITYLISLISWIIILFIHKLFYNDYKINNELDEICSPFSFEFVVIVIAIIPLLNLFLLLDFITDVFFD
jgi:hypothetical protein